MTGKTWRVVIVEDDPMVASIHRRWIDAMPGFDVVAMVPSAEMAAERLVASEVDLVILDLSLQGASGVELLRRLRRSHKPVDVIVVTASRESGTVEAVTQLGVVDYLVKPFREERFDQAMRAFLNRRAVMARDQLSQADIDRSRGIAATTMRATPKGISADTLVRVQEVLRNADEPVTAEEVGSRINISRVVARRYLEHLVQSGWAAVALRYGGTGRPARLYAEADGTGTRNAFNVNEINE
ncbi:MAG TPA: response regulator [Acidimicrobiales bacterium]|nr:response regulator [Acidimicrobiales bacterium]